MRGGRFSYGDILAVIRSCLKREMSSISLQQAIFRGWQHKNETHPRSTTSMVRFVHIIPLVSIWHLWNRPIAGNQKITASVPPRICSTENCPSSCLSPARNNKFKPHSVTAPSWPNFFAVACVMKHAHNNNKVQSPADDPIVSKPLHYTSIISSRFVLVTVVEVSLVLVVVESGVWIGSITAS